MRALPAILLLLAACAPGPRLVERALRQAEALRSAEIEAAPAVPSPLLTVAAADPLTPRALPVERGEEALLLRLHLIRAARQSIELQSYIFAADEAGRLILAELLAAARRGVRVRVLADQLFSLPDTALLAGLAAAHVGFDLRLHNPTFRRARTSAPEFAAGILCCFRSFNQRMHNKLLLIDGRLALLGGRNVQNRYFDWDPDYDFRDREVLVAGPAVAAMRESFESFWSDRGSHAVARLGGVAERLARGPPPAPMLALAEPWASRALWLRAQADDPVRIAQLFLPRFRAVARMRYFWDRPGKGWRRDPEVRDFTAALKRILAGAEREIVLQTPYLVLSRRARALFAELARRRAPPTVRVSTNSLAATDAFFVYALSHKYKRLYLRRLGFRIHEWKPHPADAPRVLAGLDFLRGPLAVAPPGPRLGMHAKTLVVDRRQVLIGSHNFTPRSADLNTENGVLIEDADFAALVLAEIERDMAGENAWRIARRERLPLLGWLSARLAELSEALPIFDLWPWRYATSFEKLPGCPELEPEDEGFRRCYREVGDFPEAPLPLKRLPTLLVTAFGLGLEPIL